MLEKLDFLREINTWSVLLRLLLAMFFGGMIGLERGRKRRAAGMRTYMLVCMGAALTVLLSLYEYHMLTSVWADLAAEIGTRTDVSRFGAQVINGIGFLAAGTIIVTGRQEVKGMTTAAGLWTAAIVGLCLGGGFYEGGIFATVLILLAEMLFSRLEYRMLENAPEINLYMEYKDRNCLERVLKLYREHDLKVLNMEITRATGSEEHNACAIFSLRLNKRCKAEALVAEINSTTGVVSVEEL